MQVKDQTTRRQSKQKKHSTFQSSFILMSNTINAEFSHWILA